MSEFKVTLARIEAVDEGEQGKQIRAVFHIERDLIEFNVPIYLRARDSTTAKWFGRRGIRCIGCSSSSPTRAKSGSFRPLSSNAFRT